LLHKHAPHRARDMSKIPYVVRRGDTLYFRIRVPAKLQAVIERKEIIQTLQTQDRQEAIPIALRVASEIKIIFNNLSKDMTDIKHKRHLEVLREKLKVRDVIHQEETERLEFTHKAEALRIERETTLRAENDLLKGALLSHANQIPVTLTRESKVKLKTPVLSTVLAEYEKKHFSHLTKRNREKYVTSFKMLNEFLGDEYVGDIKHFKMSQVFRKIERLPPNWGRREFSSMSIKQIIENNEGAGLHKSSFDGYKSPVSQFVAWAKEEYEGAFANVAVRDIKYKGTRESGEEGQRAFKSEELDKLFRCKEMKAYCGSSKDVGKFWLPVIALYTGMRVNEICQLNPFTDILDVGGIWCFLISDATEAAPDIEKSVKSGTERQVPIHSKLIELGLFDYTNGLQKAGFKRMFPLDTPHSNRAGGNTARNFRRFLEDVGLRDDAVNKKIVGMHAFRHTVITEACKSDFIRDMLSVVGHEDKVRDGRGDLLPPVTKRYIDNDVLKIAPSVKKEAIEKLTFDIDFYKPVKPVFKK